MFIDAKNGITGAEFVIIGRKDTQRSCNEIWYVNPDKKRCAYRCARTSSRTARVADQK